MDWATGQTFVRAMVRAPRDSNETELRLVAATHGVLSASSWTAFAA